MVPLNPGARWGVLGVIGVALALAAQCAAGAGVAASTPVPHIKATPNNVMVNATVTLVGRHFASNAKLVLRECGSKTWIAPNDPCNPTKIHVKTNKRGRFTQTFQATLCPRTPWPGHPVTEERCYVGKVTPAGVDVIDLVGHVKIIVTYP